MSRDQDGQGGETERPERLRIWAVPEEVDRGFRLNTSMHTVDVFRVPSVSDAEAKAVVLETELDIAEDGKHVVIQRQVTLPHIVPIGCNRDRQREMWEM